MKLADRTAIVTGAAKGMGRDICLTLAREGANLAIAAREVAPLEALGSEITALGRKAVVVPTDVTDEAAVERLVARARETFGRIDILVNAAGVTGPIETPVWEIKADDFDHVIAVNLRGTFLPTKHVLPTMIKQRYGKIVNISGTSGCAATSTAPRTRPRSGRSAASPVPSRSRPVRTTSTSTRCIRASWAATAWTSSVATRPRSAAGRPSRSIKSTWTRWRSSA